MNIQDLTNLIIKLQKGIKDGSISPQKAMVTLHQNNNSVYIDLGISLDNDMFRNGILCTNQAKNINLNLNANASNWWEVYRPWGHKEDLVRPVDKFSALVAINEILLSLKLGDAKETEKDYDMQTGKKFAKLVQVSY